jgi:hypothetical protein
MTETVHLGLPLIAAGQAQKHVTHNEALTRLDGLVQLAVKSRTLTTPPVSPAEADRYIVAAASTGAWAGKAGMLALASAGNWLFTAPSRGFLAYVEADRRLVVYDGTAWVDVSTVLAVQNLPLLGINTAADTTNRLAAKSEAVLLSAIEAASGGSGDIRVVINKELASDTASVMFQAGYSGRAELGLSGDDNIALKVSADGSTWRSAMTVDRTNGTAAFTNAPTAPTLPAGTATTQLATSAFVSTAISGLSSHATLGLLINPYFEISQERGSTAVTVGPSAAGANTYALDQWTVQARGTMAVSAQQVAAPFGVDGFRRLQNGLRVTVTTAQASLGANDGLCIEQPIEGTFLAALGLGTADARGVDIAMVVQASVAGTYTIYVQNAARDRSWNSNVTLVANTPTVVFVSVPAITSGNWATTNAVADYIGVSLGAGSSLQTATLASWQSNSARGHASTLNMAATNATTFTVAFAQAFPSGVLPYTSAAQITGENLARLLLLRRPWDEELRRCRRYWEEISVSIQSPSGGSANIIVPFSYEEKRSIPTLTLGNYAASYAAGYGSTYPYLRTGGLFQIVANAVNAYIVDQRILVAARM